MVDVYVDSKNDVASKSSLRNSTAAIRSLIEITLALDESGIARDGAAQQRRELVGTDVTLSSSVGLVTDGFCLFYTLSVVRVC